MASCSSKIKFCRAAILSSFHDGEAALSLTPAAARSRYTPGWSPCAVQNKRGTSSCPQGSPWGSVHHGRCTLCQTQALGQEQASPTLGTCWCSAQVQTQSLICVTERALSKYLQRALCCRLVPAVQRSSTLFLYFTGLDWFVKLVQFSQYS